jgi:AbrB family looped-hinge helix DNA binding protein
MEKTTVKARSRQGTKSMDLTIPAKVCEELDISPGDIFELTVKNDGSEILIYKRVYKFK